MRPLNPEHLSALRRELARQSLIGFVYAASDRDYPILGASGDMR